MIKVTFTEPKSREWQDWIEKCETRRQALIPIARARAQAGKKLTNRDIDADLYKEKRDVIFGAFLGKCAYCEVLVLADQSGDVEHFRPKGGLLDESGKAVMIVREDQTTAKHPGYYWLAYDWRNLLPSCSRCNRLTKTRQGTIGKGNLFPITGTRWSDPDQPNQEQPLFIDPRTENPKKHLIYNEQNGLMIGKTKRGQACIDRLGLNREGLPELRRDAYNLVQGAIAEADLYIMANEPEKVIQILARLGDVARGKQPFSLVGRKALDDNRDRIEQIMNGLVRGLIKKARRHFIEHQPEKAIALLEELRDFSKRNQPFLSARLKAIKANRLHIEQIMNGLN
jgi:hypothetical protein